MLTFRDVSRVTENRAVMTALAAMPRDAALQSRISAVGAVQNVANTNLNPDDRGPDSDGAPLLRCDETLIGEGVLGP